MRDMYNRKINYLRISITDRCNMRCVYCMPEEGILKKNHKDILTHEEIIEIVKAAAKLGVNKIRLTGGEPLVKKNIIELISEISQIEGINDLSLTTNGVLLKDRLIELKAAGLTRINLSLDTLDPDKYKTITRGGDLKPVLESIQMALEENMIPLKINVVLIGGFNVNEIADFVELTRSNPIHVRFIELMPIGEASDWNRDKFVSNETVLKTVKLIPVDREDKGSPATYYKLKDGAGKVGLINPISCSFCSECNRLRITSDGKIKPCLHSDEEIDLMHIVRNDLEHLGNKLLEAVKRKPENHNINEIDYQPIKRNMNRIGG